MENIKLNKNKILFPLIAVILDLFPFILLFTKLIIPKLPLTLSFSFVFPTAGLILGVAQLCRGKDVIGKAGKALSIIAIALPVAAVGFTLLLFLVFCFGAMTGLISLM